MVLEIIIQQSGSTFSDFAAKPSDFINTTEILKGTYKAALVLAPIFFFVSLGMNFVNSWIEKGHRGSFFDQKELKRAIVAWCMIMLLPGIFYAIESLGRTVGAAFEIDFSTKVAAIEEISSKMQQLAALENYGMFSLSGSALLSMLATVVMYLNVLLLYIVRFVIILLTGVLIKFLIVVSPLAGAFSILPFLSDQVTKLLKIFINACFVVLTLNILDHLFLSTLTTKLLSNILISQSGSAAATILLYKLIICTLCFSMVVFYLLSIWLTSKYAGIPGAAAALGMATTVAAITTATMLKAIGKMGGMAGGKAAGAGGKGGPGAADVLKTGAAALVEKSNN